MFNLFYKLISNKRLAQIHSYTNDSLRYPHAVYQFSKLLSRLSLKRLDRKAIPEKNSELRLFVCMRNEALRLPYFLEHHFKLGVDRVFIVDNCSEDESVKIAMMYDNVHVFQTKEPYIAYMNWVDILLDRYAENNWALVLDVDEILIYPKMDQVSLQGLCRYLQSKNYNSLRCVLLDMYSKISLKETNLQVGENPLIHCPYFDSNYQTRSAKSLDRRKWKMYESEVFVGGVRSRVFKSNSWISKIPLFFHTKELSACRGMHDLNIANYADLQGVLFHFKFFSDFLSRVPAEVERKVHYGNAREYVFYHDAIRKDDELNLFTEDSIKFESLQQLIDLEILRDSNDFR